MNPSIVNRKKIITKYNLDNKTKDIQNLQEEPIQKFDKIDISNDNQKSVEIFFENNIKQKLKSSILSRLPSSLNKFDRNNQKYNFYMKEVTDNKEPNFKTDKLIHLCIYKIINKNMTQPFILYLLYKNTENTFYFPNYRTNNTIDIKSKLSIIYQNYSNIPQYVGYKETKNNIYISAKYSIKFSGLYTM